MTTHLNLFSTKEDSYISPRIGFSSFKRSYEGYEVKKELMKKQCGLCVLCTQPYTWDELELDHIIPLVLIPKGKEHYVTNIYNLQLSCSKCNKKKGTVYKGNYALRYVRNKSYILQDYSEDIYKQYKRIIKELIEDKYKNERIQQLWNRECIIHNKKISTIKEERLIFDIYPLDIDKLIHKS